MNGSIASANNATLATAAANYGLKTVVDQHSLDISRRWRSTPRWPTLSWALSPPQRWPPSSTPPSRGCRPPRRTTAYGLLSAVDTPRKDSTDAALLGKADASALAALLSTVDGLDTPLEVDTKIANALLGLATEAFVAAQLLAVTPASRRSRRPRPTRRRWPRTPRTPRSQPARPRSRAPSTQSSRSSPPCFPAAAQLLTRRPGRASQLGSLFAEATSFATCIWRLLSLLRWPTATTR